MDLTYLIPDLGVSQIILNFNVEPLSPTFLVSLTTPDGTSIKNMLLSPQGCDGSWIGIVDSVNLPYESLTDGMIFFNQLGTWGAKIYAQASNSNTDPDNAVFLADAIFQVVCDEDQFLLDNLLNLPI